MKLRYFGKTQLLQNSKKQFYAFIKTAAYIQWIIYMFNEKVTLLGETNLIYWSMSKSA